MPEPRRQRLAPRLPADAVSETARDAVRIASSSVLALADTADDAARRAGRDLAQRFGLPTRADVDRLGTAVSALQSAVAALEPRASARRH